MAALVVTIDDVNVTPRHRGFSIREYARGQINVVTFTIHGTIPELGAEVRVGIGDLTPANLLFGGHVAERTFRFDTDNSANPIACEVSCQSYDWLLDRKPVFETYAAQSASLIVADIIATYCIGFPTPTAIESGLASVAIEFDGQKVSEALDRLADRVGGEWYLDASKNLHFYVTADTVIDADDLTDANNYARDLILEESLLDVRTFSVLVGASTTLEEPVVAGADAICIKDATPFTGGSGGMKLGNALVNYNGVIAGGGGSLLVATTYPAGNAYLVVTSLAPYSSAGGWVQVLGHRIRYTGTTTSPNNRLTGIPASGPGSIPGFTSDGTIAAVPLPCLNQIPTTPPGSIPWAFPAGTQVAGIGANSDPARESELAGAFGSGDGSIWEINNNSGIPAAEQNTYAAARVAFLKQTRITLRFETRNASVRAGRTLYVNLTKPAIVATLRINAVTFDGFEAPGDGGSPRRIVEASSRLVRFDQFLRALRPVVS